MVDLKHAIEQGIRQALVLDFKYRENHYFINIHLAFGYIAAISSISSAWYSYTHPFEEFLTKQIIVFGCAMYLFLTSYFFFTTILAVFNRFVKRDIIFVGEKSTNETVTVHLKTDKYSNIVELYFEFKKDGKESSILKKKSVTKWFTEKGEFAASAFLQDITLILQDSGKKLK